MRVTALLHTAPDVMETGHQTSLPSNRTLASNAEALPIRVWVLVPFVETSDPNLAYYNDYSQSRAEYTRAFAALALEWVWQPVTLDDHRAIIDAIAATDGVTPLVFNLCDGDETNGVPGLSVVKHLQLTGLCFTGADADFFDVTTSKIPMKRIFDAAGVPTAPWLVLHLPTDPSMDGKASAALANEAFARCGSPLIVKPAISAGSMGLTVDSVVHTSAALRSQLAALRDGYRGWDLASGGVFVERFVRGAEYTTFIVGSSDAPDACIVYPPVERVFNRALPETERFLSFDRLWEIYERETPLEHGAYLWEYAPVPDALGERIADVSWQAYASLGGRGYGRVDLRLDAETDALYVLEVNAQCGLSEDENYTSIGAILRFAHVPFADVVLAIMRDAMRTRTYAADDLVNAS